jgi:hypothetical protein
MLHCCKQFDTFASLLVFGAVFLGNSAVAQEGPSAVRKQIDLPQVDKTFPEQKPQASVLLTEPIFAGRYKSSDAPLAGLWHQKCSDTASDKAWVQLDVGTSLAQESPTQSIQFPDNLDLDSEVIQNSPVLQEWLRDIPDIADEIRNQPSFRTRVRVGYARFPSSNQADGIHIGVEDIFLVTGTGLTASGSFSRSWNNERESFGVETRYYLLPLGSYVNLAPTLGYRSLETPSYTTNGVDLGFRLLFVPSRGGGADIAIGQHWVAPGSPEEVGMTSISVGYAVTPRLRLGTDVEFQNSRSGQESRVGLLLEWLM